MTRSLASGRAKRDSMPRFWVSVYSRNCLDDVVVLGERHLHRVLTSYFAYYHGARCHLSLDGDAPEHRESQPPAMGKVIELPEVGGLHHHYVRRAA